MNFVQRPTQADIIAKAQNQYERDRDHHKVEQRLLHILNHLHAVTVDQGDEQNGHDADQLF